MDVLGIRISDTNGIILITEENKLQYWHIVLNNISNKMKCIVNCDAVLENTISSVPMFNILYMYTSLQWYNIEIYFCQ